MAYSKGLPWAAMWTTSSPCIRTTAPAPSTIVSSTLSTAVGMSKTRVRCQTFSMSTSPPTLPPSASPKRNIYRTWCPPTCWTASLWPSTKRERLPPSPCPNSSSSRFSLSRIGPSTLRSYLPTKASLAPCSIDRLSRDPTSRTPSACSAGR
eukprot:5576194-Pleurochrysis_carterae.AAC.2